MNKFKVGSKVSVTGKYGITCAGCERTVYSKMFGAHGKVLSVKRSLAKYIYTVAIYGEKIEYMENELHAY